MTNLTNTSTTKQFFDLHIKGIGYVNRIREVTVKKGQPYLSCTIAALRGNSEDVEYTYFECNVTGEKAKDLMERCIEASDLKKKILISFCLGDLYSETFTYSKGAKQGQTGVSLKARLLKVTSIKIDGELKYSDKEQSSENQVESPSNDEQGAA
ncbi:STY4534 family ICE replication protein [Orbus sturtevantii]|uniref:STY4534 family ICE replication protein n=1 Tax=Orbus sturtevantii TaxID=3074109 RepID=UPI00370DA57C